MPLSSSNLAALHGVAAQVRAADPTTQEQADNLDEVKAAFPRMVSRSSRSALAEFFRTHYRGDARYEEKATCTVLHIPKEHKDFWEESAKRIQRNIFRRRVLIQPY